MRRAIKSKEKALKLRCFKAFRVSYRHEKDGFAFFVDGFEPPYYKDGYKTPMSKELGNPNKQALLGDNSN